MKALALFMVLSACHVITAYPDQPEQTQAAFQTRTAVQVHWQPDIDAIAKVCPVERPGIIYACATWNGGICDVYAIQPKDFNDEPKLAVLGHELMHCLGARH